ncbi:MAG: pyrroline-5-carboxylate reductase [Burkholderiales bacterium]|nr:pyrroline-5-carboxylate reductase [Burkholderiales bacterium]
MQSDLKIGFIGGGNMAGALISGLVKQVNHAQQLLVVDLNADSLQKLSSTFGVATAQQIDQRLAEMDVIVFAVKPQQMQAVVKSVQPFVRTQLLLSVAAGIRASDMARWLGDYQKIVRAMPNTPAMIGQGMTGLFALEAVSEQEKNAAQAIMQAVGQTIWVENESLIDAVTAVSGSGPAYVFYFIEALQQAGIALGLSEAQAKQMALATFNGAAQLAQQSEEPIHVLRERVTSKGGTTYAALTSMEADGVANAIVRAVHAAANRGRELGEEFGQG